MFILTIQGSTPEEVKSKFDQWAKFLGITQSQETIGSTIEVKLPDAISEAPTPVVEEEKLPKSEPKKRGRKPKVEVVLPAGEEPVEETAPSISEAVTTEAPAAITATKAEMEAALKSVFEQKGITTASAVLASFGFKRMSEVKEASFGEVVTACKKALAA
jgi:hypothetical protein